MNKKYTHLFFDLDNTLWDFETNSENAMKVAFSKFLPEKSDFNLFFETYSEINHQLWKLYRQNGITKKDLTRRRFLDTFEKLGIEKVDPDEMNHFYLEVMPDQKTLNSGVVDLLRYLKSRFYKMAIITNGFSDVQRRKLETSDLKEYFLGIFISEEIKAPKPDKAIFEHALKSMNARKPQSLMIGDDWEVDVLGAAGFGIDVVYYDKNAGVNLEMRKNPFNKKSLVYCTGILQELKQIL
jgi:putative hydrolase of the HAD superfamily